MKGGEGHGVVNAMVSNRIMTVEGDIELICNNPTDVIQIMFDNEWKDKKGYCARFQWGNDYIDVPFTGNQVKVPEITNTNWVLFGVYADNLTTIPAKIKCKKSILCYGDEVRQPPANPFYDNFNDRLKRVEETISQGGGTGGGGGNANLPVVTPYDDGKVLIVSSGTWVAGELPKYDGIYNVVPSVRDQTLATSQKLMDADLRIEKIPYAEVTNSANGTTATIG